jgi:hypothetical protein
MKFIAALLLVVCASATAATPGVPFLAHDQSGTPYWVVTCWQNDECLESAYIQCGGAYTWVDKQFRGTDGFRFWCNSPKKIAKKAKIDPDVEAAFPK